MAALGSSERTGRGRDKGREKVSRWGRGRADQGGQRVERGREGTIGAL